MTLAPARRRRLATFSLALLAHPATASVARAQKGSVRDSASDGAVVAYLRAEVPRLMARLDIPGAVVVVARHDRQLMNEGFGLADVERRIPVDAEQTVFRVASVAKVFTAMAALQMVHAGRVGLSQDLRPLLPDVLTRGDIAAPVTLHQLLTHTAGFDEQLIGYVNPPGISAAPLASYLAASLPPRTRPPLPIPGYSNHGYGVVGLLVERLAKRPFHEYARDDVFRPLGMLHTGFILQPTDSTPALAREYRSDGSRRIPRSTRAYPAGNVGTTGADMSLYLRWLLGAVRSADSATASARIARALAGPTLVYHPALPPMGDALNGVPMAGRTVWMKGGSGPSHSAVIAVIPALDVALFIAVNRQEPLLWDRLIPRLVERFWADSAGLAVDTAAPDASSRLAGSYRWTRAPLGSREKIIGLATQLHVTAEKRSIAVAGMELEGTWRQVGAATFRDSAGRTLAFAVDSAGRGALLFSAIQGQPVSFERARWYEDARALLGALAIASVLGLVAAGAVVRRRSVDPALRWPRAALLALPLLELASVGAGVLLARQVELLQQGPTATLRVALALAAVTGAVGIVQMAGSLLLAARRGVSVPRRALYIAGAFGGAGVAWFLGANNLLWPL